MEDDIDRRPSPQPPLHHIVDDADSAATTSTSFVYQSGHQTSTYFPKSRHHIYNSPRKLQVDLNPRFVSTLTNNPQKLRHAGASHRNQQLEASAPSSYRVRPYFVPERTRTKSENAAPDMVPSVSQPYPQLINWLPEYTATDHTEAGTVDRGNVPGMMDTTPSSGASEMMYAMAGMNVASTSSYSNALDVANQCDALPVPTVLTKKYRSLEDVSRCARPANGGTQTSHEMEFMSSRIQKMRVQDE